MLSAHILKSKKNVKSIDKPQKRCIIKEKAVMGRVADLKNAPENRVFAVSAVRLDRVKNIPELSWRKREQVVPAGESAR